MPWPRSISREPQLGHRLVPVVIRAGEHRDLPDITRIYNHYVLTSHVTFDVEPVTLGERELWFPGFGPRGRQRLYVAEDEGRSVGYATSTPIRPKPAYVPSVETTVYVSPERVGRGIGRILYEKLLSALEEEDVHRAYAGIALPNPPSVALHEALGYRHVGTFSEAGRKFGRYWSIGWWERRFE